MLTTLPNEDIFAAVKDLGGWGAFLVATVWGGRTFMALARDFSSKVCAELSKISEAMVMQTVSHERIEERLESLSDQQDQQTEAIQTLLRHQMKP